MPNTSIQNEQKTLLTLKEAAIRADRSVKTIRNWIKKGELESTRKIPGNQSSQILIKLEDLLIYLGTNCQAFPPRKQASISNEAKVETNGNSTQIEMETSGKSTPKEVETNGNSTQTGMETSGNSTKTEMETINKLQIQILLLQKDLLHKTNMINMEREVREKLETFSQHTIKELMSRISSLEEDNKELQHKLEQVRAYEIAYAERLGMSWFTRAFNPPKRQLLLSDFGVVSQINRQAKEDPKAFSPQYQSTEID